MNYYTGIGSRKTPQDILNLMTDIAKYLYDLGYTLRSGHADGADKAFEKGAKDNKEIFLPWKGFNRSESKLYTIPMDAFIMAKSAHPCWEKCNIAAQKLHARNVLQVYGRNLNSCSKFLICWTRNAKFVGGTATAMKLAEKRGIPIFNLAREDHKKRILNKLNRRIDGIFNSQN